MHLLLLLILLHFKGKCSTCNYAPRCTLLEVTVRCRWCGYIWWPACMPAINAWLDTRQRPI